MIRRPSFRSAALLATALIAATLLAVTPTALHADEPAAPPSAEQSELIASLFDDTSETTIVHETYADLLDRKAIQIEPSAKGDPMAIGFRVDAVALESAHTKMNAAYSAARYDDALGYADWILRNHPTSGFADDARSLQEAQRIGCPPPREFLEEGPHLPGFIRTNTKMILKGEDGAMVMVGYEMLGVGDAVPGYPEVVVEAIRDGEVDYRVTEDGVSKAFTLSIQTP